MNKNICVQTLKRLVLLVVWLVTMPFTVLAVGAWTFGWDAPLLLVIDKFDDLTEWVIE